MYEFKPDFSLERVRGVEKSNISGLMVFNEILGDVGEDRAILERSEAPC